MTNESANNTIKTALFSAAFLFSRVPYWFVFIAAMNGFISLSKFILIAICVSACRSYVDSELFGAGFFRVTAGKFLDVILFIAGVICCYITAIYYGTAADTVDKLLISGALFLIVILYYNTKDDGTAGNHYTQPFGGRIVCTLCWLYIAFVPDSLTGNLLVLAAIYLIEIQNFISSRLYLAVTENQGL